MATYSSATTNYYTLQLTVTETATSTENNTSTLAYSLVLKTGSTYFDAVKIGYTIKIDGTTVASLNYSSATAKSMSKNSSWTIKSGTTTITHNADGTKSISAGAISASLNTATGNIVPNLSLASSSALTLTAIPRASSITTSAASNLMGETRTITISRASSSFVHTLTYSFGSATGTIATKTTSTSVNWTVPTSLAAQVASGSIRASGTITCTTYASSSSSAPIGTSTSTFLAQIPATQPTSDKTSLTMGTAVTISVSSRVSSSLTHKLTYNFNSGAKTGTIVSSTSAASYSWTVPTSFAAYVTSGSISSSCVVTCTTYNGSASVGTNTVTIDTITIPKSTFTLSASSVTVGTGTLTIDISRAASNLTHTIQYSADNSTWSNIVTRTSSTSYDWTPSYTIAKNFTGTSATYYIRVRTYNYSSTEATGSVGYNVSTFTIKIASTSATKPSVSLSLSSSISSGTFSGLYIQGRATVKCTYSAAAANNGAGSPSYYADLVSYTLKIGGATAKSETLSGTTLSSTNYTSATLTSTGSISVVLTVTDSHGFSTSSTQTITVQPYTTPMLTARSNNTKVIVGRANASGTLSASGTYLHIEVGRIISQIKNASNTQVNYGYIHYRIGSGSWTAIGSGSTTATADGPIINTDDTPLELTETYSVQLRVYDTFSGSSNAVIISYTIPTDRVTMDWAQGGRGIGIGRYADGGLDRLDVAWDAWFNGRVLPGQLSSLVSSDSSVRSNIILPGRHLASDIMGAADSFPYNAYLEAWLKRICVDHPGATTTTAFFGTATPGSGGAGIIACEIDSTGDISGGLPNNSSGFLIPRQNSAIIRFGTTGYTFWYRVIYANDSEDGTLTYTNNSLIPEAQFANIGLKKSGKVVTLSTTSGITPSSTSGGTSYTTIGTLPSGFYPQTQTEIPIVLRSTTYYSAFIQVTTAGNIRLYKNNTSTNILNFAMSWITA